MTTIGGISASNNLSPLQPAFNTGSSTGRVDSSNNAGGDARRIGGDSNFMQSLLQALSQSINGGSSSSSSTTSSSATSTTPASGSPPDVLSALQAFMQNLFSALHQQDTTSSTGTDSAGSNNASSTASGVGQPGGHHHHGGGMAAKIQSLMQQLSAGSQGATATTSPNTQGNTTDPLSTLNTSFQNLVGALGGSLGTSTNTATLQTFLQNLQQDMAGGQNISGAVVNTSV